MTASDPALDRLLRRIIQIDTSGDAIRQAGPAIGMAADVQWRRCWAAFHAAHRDDHDASIDIMSEMLRYGSMHPELAPGGGIGARPSERHIASHSERLSDVTAAIQRAEHELHARRNERETLVVAAATGGLTLAQIAQAIGLTRGRVNQIVRGRR
jgi:predicted XRE-type DNA-binding protein